MTRSRHDSNRDAIISALEKCGCSVVKLDGVGGGCPDLLVGGRMGRNPWRKTNLLMEVKDGSKPPSKQKLSPAQVKFHEEWRGQVCVVKSVDGALKAVGVET